MFGTRVDTTVASVTLACEPSAGEAALSLPTQYIFRPDIKGGYPPNLSILISGGKENNCDSLSNGE